MWFCGIDYLEAQLPPFLTNIGRVFVRGVTILEVYCPFTPSTLSHMYALTHPSSHNFSPNSTSYSLPFSPYFTLCNSSHILLSNQSVLTPQFPVLIPLMVIIPLLAANQHSGSKLNGNNKILVVISVGFYW